MELLKAIERMNKLNSDIENLDQWLSDLQFNDKPVKGREWLRLKKAVDGVIGDLAEERDILEEKIKQVTENIEIDHK